MQKESYTTHSKFLTDGVGELPGNIQVQYVRCGKKGCRCMHGELHGPYYYRVWREGMKVRKEYVRAEDVVAIQEACDYSMLAKKSLREARKRRMKLVREMHAQWTLTKRLVTKANVAAR